MLVLSRKINESIVIGENIRITTTSIRNRQVRLAIEAPPEVHIIRQELIAGYSATGPDCNPGTSMPSNDAAPA